MAFNQLRAAFNFYRGIRSDARQHYAQAVKYYTQAVGLGCEEAQVSLGQCYLSGKGTAQDYAKAVEWYEKAVDAGCLWAMCNLANLYLYGRLESGKDDCRRAKQTVGLLHEGAGH